MLTRFADEVANAESHSRSIPLNWSGRPSKSRLPRVPPPPDLILGFGELDIILPEDIWEVREYFIHTDIYRGVALLRTPKGLYPSAAHLVQNFLRLRRQSTPPANIRYLSVIPPHFRYTTSSRL